MRHVKPWVLAIILCAGCENGSPPAAGYVAECPGGRALMVRNADVREGMLRVHTPDGSVWLLPPSCVVRPVGSDWSSAEAP
jgi:hypothetical protein